ncbi:type III pantothenate kinase [Dasania sp. GY-19]|uniref:Type III pantothenate kinase n=1 Tax=Dasania phycosphaerae TaxID=2950436 RepID=A0A9J6RRT3_9GAMM|nr:type III pantothenate kinase [Dasania phycosphaerae]MCZ0866993.1 type III pantothenate kinase [Dasania phycosphaerae]
MLLECDLGNTRYKWRLCADGAVINRGSGLYDEGAYNDIVLTQPLTHVRAASVTSDQRTQGFTDYIGRRYGVRPQWAVSQAHCAGVTNAYKEAGLLGVDRWLAVLAAYRLRGAALIIDAGSAITVDVVDGEGRHLGGYIAPGAELMARSLQSETAKVRYESQPLFSALAFGQDTAAAVAAGIAAAQLGIAEQAVRQAKLCLEGDFSVLITGGGAQGLIKDLSVAAEFAPDIVLDGLQWALP